MITNRPSQRCLRVASLVVVLFCNSSAARASDDGDAFWGELALPGYARYLKLVIKARAALEATPAKPAEAAALLEQAVGLLPNRSEAHFGLGIAFAELGRHADSKPHLERAASLGVPETARRTLYERLGQVRLALGDHAGALTAFDRALAIMRAHAVRASPSRRGSRPVTVQHSGEAWAETSAGQALMALGRLDEAIERYRHAVTLDSNFPPAWFCLAMALVRQERVTSGRDALRRALQLDPGARALRGPAFMFAPPADEHFAFALIDWLQGRPAQAISRLRRYLELAKEGPYLAQANALLVELDGLSSHPLAPAPKLKPKPKGR